MDSIIVRVEDPAKVKEIFTEQLQVTPPEEFERVKIQAKNIIDSTQNDPGAPFEPPALKTLATIKGSYPAEWQRIRVQLKKCGVAITDLEKALRSASNPAGESNAIADALTRLVVAECELFHDSDGEPYASFNRDGHTESWPVYSRGFEEWISWRLYETEDKAPRKAALEDAQATIAGRAKFEGIERAVALRAAKDGDTYYIDLADDGWRAIEITPRGWSIVARPPVVFLRTRNMRALPVPESSGKISKLWKFANIPEPAQLLVLTWLIECLRADTQFPPLELVGEQGSGKSFTQEVLRNLTDPNEVNLRGAPKNAEEVFISAKNNHVVSYENLSHLPGPIQDAFCILCTGGGHAGRTFYTNSDETVLKAKRPVIFNGIASVATAPDLLSRAISIVTEPLNVRNEQELKADFDASKGAILGSLLDLFVKALTHLPSIFIAQEDNPRMADMAQLGCAVSKALGGSQQDYLNAYNRNRREAIERTIDASPVATAVINYCEKCHEDFNGTTKQLYETLSLHKPDEKAGWPKSAKGLADALRKLAPALRIMGIKVAMNTGKTKRGITCELTPTEAFFSIQETYIQNKSSQHSPFSPGCSTNHREGEHGEYQNGEKYHAGKKALPEEREVIDL